MSAAFSSWEAPRQSPFSAASIKSFIPSKAVIGGFPHRSIIILASEVSLIAALTPLSDRLGPNLLILSFALRVQASPSRRSIILSNSSILADSVSQKHWGFTVLSISFSIPFIFNFILIKSSMLAASQAGLL